MAYLNHNLPPFSAYIRNEYLFDHEKGHGEYTFADVHTVNSLERRALLFECLLPNGVNWTRRPIHAFCWKKDAPKHNLNIHQYWDCFSPYVDVQRRNRLANCRAELVDYKGVKRKGTYMFTIDWAWENKAGMLDTNFSEDPEHKCAQMFRMDDGNFFAYPNNYNYYVSYYRNTYQHGPQSWFRVVPRYTHRSELNFYQAATHH
jgi:hypothetical protein